MSTILDCQLAHDRQEVPAERWRGTVAEWCDDPKRFLRDIPQHILTLSHLVEWVETTAAVTFDDVDAKWSLASRLADVLLKAVGMPDVGDSEADDDDNGVGYSAQLILRASAGSRH